MAILVDKFVENNVHIPATSICTSSAPEKFLIQITKMSDYCVTNHKEKNSAVERSIQIIRTELHLSII